ncbi:unnamed protein product [Caenorhabditis sp. 36 PRJEB53466]|nr:unnamed protein product [Caenorhabditis sp. 36 PRJEB53466]
MRRFLRCLLLFSIFLLLKTEISSGLPAKDRRVLPNIDALFCTNEKLRRVVFSALQNITDPSKIAVDQVQSAIEIALMPTFKSSGGVWLVTATSYHRVNGYVDDRASDMDTFCAVNDVNFNLYVVIMKIDN